MANGRRGRPFGGAFATLNQDEPTPDEIVSIRKALAATQVTAVFGQIMVVLDPTFAPKK